MTFKQQSDDLHLRPLDIPGVLKRAPRRRTAEHVTGRGCVGGSRAADADTPVSGRRGWALKGVNVGPARGRIAGAWMAQPPTASGGRSGATTDVSGVPS